MHHGIDRARPQQLVERATIRQFANHQRSAFRHCLAVAPAEIVEDDNFVPGLQEFVGNHAADVARAPCNQNSHRSALIDSHPFPDPSVGRSRGGSRSRRRSRGRRAKIHLGDLAGSFRRLEVVRILLESRKTSKHAGRELQNIRVVILQRIVIPFPFDGDPVFRPRQFVL